MNTSQNIHFCFTQQIFDGQYRLWGVNNISLMADRSQWLSVTKVSLSGDKINNFGVRRNGSQSGEFLPYTPRKHLKYAIPGERKANIPPFGLCRTAAGERKAFSPPVSVRNRQKRSDFQGILVFAVRYTPFLYDG